MTINANSQNANPGKNPTSTTRSKSRRGPVIVVILIVMVAAIVAGIIFAVTSRQKDETPTTEIDSSMSEADVLSSLSKVFAEEGGDAGLAECERLISTFDTPEKKSTFYLYCASRMTLLQNENFNARILDYAYKAEELFPSADSAQDISIYEHNINHDEEKAQEYLNLAISRRGDSSSEGTAEARDEMVPDPNPPRPEDMIYEEIEETNESAESAQEDGEIVE